MVTGRLAILVAALFGATVTPAYAQVVAPPLERGAAELGFAYKWFHRDVTSGQTAAIEWEAASVYGRYGAWDWLTITVEGGLWEVDKEGDPRHFTRWVVGGGVAARVYWRERWKLLATGTFNEVYDLDESQYRSDERTVSWTAALLADLTLGDGPHRLDVWAGPMFVDDTAEVYAFNSWDPEEIETEPALGFALGAYGVLYEYMSGFAYVVYAEYPQVRLGFSLRSRGDRP